MRKRKLIVLSVLFIYGCGKQIPPKIYVPPVPQKAVNIVSVVLKDKDIVTFLQAVKNKDFHGAEGMSSIGEKLFRSGNLIPNHAQLFKGYPTIKGSNGETGYVFYSTQSKSGGAEVTLYLEPKDGKIVNFVAMTFEK